MDKKNNPCRLEKQINVNLPGDMLNDLTEAFAFYDKDDSSYISIPHFRNILHNFGFHRLSKREIDDEMRRQDIDFLKRNCADFNFTKHVIAYRWNKVGATEEAKECFRLFDKRDRDVITFKDIKDVLSSMLEFPVTDHDVEEFITECDPTGSGQVTGRAFVKLYNSWAKSLQTFYLCILVKIETAHGWKFQIIYALNAFKLIQRCLFVKS